MPSFNYKKKFGQHFLRFFPAELTDDVLQLSEETELHIVEIGPGNGALTIPLLQELTKKFTNITYHCVDIDSEALSAVKERISEVSEAMTVKVEYHLQDVLTVMLQDFHIENGALLLLGSLPYNISKQIISWTFRELSTLDRNITILPVNYIIQKEVADVYLSTPPDADFLSHTMRLFADRAENLRILPPGAFVPPPKVTSALLHIVPKKLGQKEHEEIEKVGQFIKKCFNFPRKKLAFALSKHFSHVKWPENVEEVMQKRPQEVTTDEFLELFRVMITTIAQ
ncbi:MAG: rRNA adenine dimethyltransferase family protein [Candidatus Dojkabacteria bacterium]|nr:MAG: rRNA adenine dimethyltransferase family protein [Candidatus Dojkabacteria bacterium]